MCVCVSVSVSVCVSVSVSVTNSVLVSRVFVVPCCVCYLAKSCFVKSLAELIM